jgi:hypothetical protein
VAVTVAVLISAAPGGAQTRPGDTESYGDLIGDGAEIGVFQPSQGGPSGGGGPTGGGNESNVVCDYTIRQGSVDLPFSYNQAMAEYTARGNSPVPVDWNCMDGTEVVGSGTIQWTPDQGDLVSPEVLAQMARDRLFVPAPAGDVAPSLEVGTQAQMPTYFWIDNWPGEGELPSASASAGGVTVTAVATPVSHTWVIEDALREGQTVPCNGPGVAFTGEGPAPADACSWTPTHSSAGQPTRHPTTDEPCFPAQVTVVWNVTWSGGDLGPIESSASACIVVHEIQAVVSES